MPPSRSGRGEVLRLRFTGPNLKLPQSHVGTTTTSDSLPIDTAKDSSRTKIPEPLNSGSDKEDIFDAGINGNHNSHYVSRLPLGDSLLFSRKMLNPELYTPNPKTPKP